MEDSLKGWLLMLTIVGLFITCIINFVTIFPQEQGVSFSGVDQGKYLVVKGINADPTTSLSTINNQSKEGFDQWDVTQGFMGSNSIKQSSKTETTSYSSNVFSNVLTLAKQVFGEGSPVIYVIGVLMAFAGTYIIYLTIKFIRTGL